MKFIRNNQEYVYLAALVAGMLALGACIGAANRGGAEWAFAYLFK